ncbi:MAG: hypothetical protein ABGW69_02140 [Nanoarchaeota archaeon]
MEPFVREYEMVPQKVSKDGYIQYTPAQQDSNQVPQQLQQIPQQVQQPYYQNQQHNQEKEKNRGVDICFRYNEKTQTYKKLRIEKTKEGHLWLIIIEGEKGKGSNRSIIQLNLEDLIKLKWIIDKEIENLRGVFEL